MFKTLLNLMMIMIGKIKEIHYKKYDPFKKSLQITHKMVMQTLPKIRECF